MTNRVPKTDDHGIAFDNEAPPPGPAMWVFRVKGKSPETFTCFSKWCTGVWVHWNGHRSEPHYKKASTCPGCIAKRGKEWKGYLHAFHHEANQQVIVELTPKSWDAILTQLPSRECVRGMRFTLQRRGSEKGHLLVSMLQPNPKPDKLPEPIDPTPIILAFYGAAPGRAWGDGPDFPVPSQNGVLR